MHCMLIDLLHGFEVLSTTEETLFNSRNVSRLVQNNHFKVEFNRRLAFEIIVVYGLFIFCFAYVVCGNNGSIYHTTKTAEK